MKKRILSVFLVISFMLPCFAVPTSAALALPGGVAASGVGIVRAGALASRAGVIAKELAGYLGMDEQAVQAILDYLVSVTGYGNLGHGGLQAACNRLNQISANPDKYARMMYEDGIAIGYDFLPVDFEVFYDGLVQWTAYGNDLADGWHVINSTQYGYVIANQSETFILADSVGRYPYAEEVTDKWLGSRTALSASTVNLATDYSLKNLQSVHQDLHPDWTFRRTNVTLQDGKYTVLQAASDGIHYDQILCDSLGFPYGIPLGNTQMGNDRDYNNDKEGQPEVSDEPIVDIDANLVYQMFPDGSFTWINNLTYDASNKTYYVDASTSYDVDNNYYYSYEWHYTYHIDYTSITYIGQTAEYDEVYEYYYQLPDGRSSADLTAEELQALNTQIDVLPYIRSADDTSIRALYHFDGDTRDSSYWSHLGEFTWNKGASITYMDAGAFNGALYLDENAHEYSITLPSNIGTGDFTVQFRLYISATPTPVNDSYFTVGPLKVGINGEALTVGAGTELAALSNGAWQDICLMRKDGTTYLFLNGVKVTAWANTTSSIADVINFVWGAEQQTFKYFDEFRVVNKAVYPVTGYTSSLVPFDTNLALVLPDSQVPVADEYWEFTSSKTNLLDGFSLSNWVDPTLSSSSIYNPNTAYPSVILGDVYPYTPGPDWEFGQTRNASSVNKLAYYNNYYMQLNNPANVSGCSFGLTAKVIESPGQRALLSKEGTYSPDYVQIPAYGFTLLLGYQYLDWSANNRLIAVGDGGTYTFSMVAADGEVGSFTFTLPSMAQTFSETMEFNGYTIEFGGSLTGEARNSGHAYWLSFYPTSKDVPGGNFVYLELVNGDSTDLSAELISSVVVMDKDDLHTPSLAVRTDVDITSYQIGGVRPSLPEKGLVWALVENSRITSLQIYNGQAWEEVDGRIWTGSRWVPYYAYDVLLLKDMWDIVEADPTLNPIYTEQGFWSWLQGAWGEMMGKLDQIIEALGGSPGSGDTCAHVYESEISREATCSEPGHMTYTCSLCGHSYVELIDTIGHDWLVTDTVYDGTSTLLPEGYRQLEYIESTGTQYVDTGFVPDQDTRIDLDVTSLDASNAGGGVGFIPYGAAYGYGNSAFECYSWNGSHEINYGTGAIFVGNIAVGERVLISHNRNTVSVTGNGSTASGSLEPQSFTSPYTMTLFASHRASPLLSGPMRIYSCKIWDNDVLVRDLVPCINNAGAAGLYDLINGIFYGNSGSGNFVLGAEIGAIAYKELTCSKCGAVSRDYGDGPEEVDLFDVLGDCVSFLYGLLSGTVFHGVSDFFSVFTDGSLFEGFQQTDENGNTTTGLPEGVGAVFADFSGMISALPAELLSVLVFGICLLFLLAVIMLF